MPRKKKTNQPIVAPRDLNMHHIIMHILDALIKLNDLPFTAGGGRCYGTFKMAVNACFADMIVRFNTRLDLLRLVSLINDDLMNDLLSTDQLAFLIGVQLYQDRKCSSYLFEKTLQQHDDAEINALLEPDVLLQAGHLITLPLWTHNYNPEQLTFYLEDLKSAAADNHFSFAIEISNYDHALGFFYHHVEKMWYFIDANRLPISPVHLDKMAYHIRESFFDKNQNLLFNSSISFPVNQHENAKIFFQDLYQKMSAQHLFRLTPKLAKQVINEKSLAVFAVQAGNVQLLSQLIQRGIDVNQKFINQVLLLELAVTYSHRQVIALLLNAGARVRMTSVPGEYKTPLSSAVQSNCLASVQQLIQAEPRLRDKPSLFGISPVKLALREAKKVQHPNAELIAYLRDVKRDEFINACLYLGKKYQPYVDPAISILILGLIILSLPLEMQCFTILLAASVSLITTMMPDQFDLHSGGAAPRDATLFRVSR